MGFFCSCMFFILLCFSFLCFFFFFFNDTATTEIYTLSLHDALPTCWPSAGSRASTGTFWPVRHSRSEEHTSELQSQFHLVCRLLLEKKKKNLYNTLDRKQKRKSRVREQNTPII